MREVSWGVTRLADAGISGQRVRAGDGWSTKSRQRALAEASKYGDESEARLVKLARRAKGWRPASEPPKSTRLVLTILNDGGYRIGHWNTEWFLFGIGAVRSVAHWRELPARPK